MSTGSTSDQKLLLIGPSGGGKTCMRRVIFENYLPRDVRRISLTVGLENSRVHVLNNLHLGLWDCGGQKEYVANYLLKQKEYIFRGVCVMLFVVDVLSLSVTSDPNATALELKESDDLLQFANSLLKDKARFGGGAGGGAAGGAGGSSENVGIASSSASASATAQSTLDWSKQEMLDYFVSAIAYLREYSPNAKVCVLLHKVDMVSPSYRDRICEQRKQDMLSRLWDCNVPESFTSQNIDFFPTTIWSHSLYYAYSTVVRGLIPQRSVLVNELKKIHKACEAGDVALYERNTFLTIAHVDEKGEVDGQDSENRTAQLADIMKSFKLSCLCFGVAAKHVTMTLATGGTATLCPFTESTVMLVVSHDARAQPEIHAVNVEAARVKFMTYLQSRDPTAVALRNVL